MYFVSYYVWISYRPVCFASTLILTLSGVCIRFSNFSNFSLGSNISWGFSWNKAGLGGVWNENKRPIKYVHKPRLKFYDLLKDQIKI